MTDFFLSALKLFLQFWVGQYTAIIELLLAPLVDKIPDLTPQTNCVAEYLTIANDWIALDYGMGMLGVYMIYIVLMIAIKLVIKLFIPTVG